MSIAVLDVGKTTLKLVITDAVGAVLHMAATPNRSEPGPPYPHLPVEAIWAWLVQALAAAPDREAIAAIVPVSHGCAAAVMAGGALALPVLDYEHDGPQAVDELYATLAGPFEETYDPLLPLGLNLGRQLLWQETAFPKAWAGASAILPYPQYWAWRLSGVAATEVTSIGCHSHLWNPNRHAYASLVERRGWERLMPTIRQAWDTLGPILPEVAAQTGLRADCRVLCGIHDSNASYAAHLAWRAAPFTVLSTGTWIIIMAAGGNLKGLDPARDTLAYTDLRGDPVPTARFMGGREFSTIAGEDGLQTVASPACLARLVAQGSMASPSFFPFAGPHIGRQGRFAGPPATSPEERAGLAALYCALTSDLCLDLIGSQGPLIVDGPFAANRAYLTSLAALRPHQPVLAQVTGGGPAEGAALLASWPARAGAGGEEEVTPAKLDGLDAYRAAWRGSGEA